MYIFYNKYFQLWIAIEKKWQLEQPVSSNTLRQTTEDNVLVTTILSSDGIPELDSFYMVTCAVRNPSWRMSFPSFYLFLFISRSNESARDGNDKGRHNNTVLLDLSLLLLCFLWCAYLSLILLDGLFPVVCIAELFNIAVDNISIFFYLRIRFI